MSTKVLGALKEACERSGFEVLGAAPTRSATVQLQQGAGIRSVGVRRLLFDLYPRIFDHLRDVYRGKRSPHRLRMGKKTVLVVDEATMLGTVEATRLLSKAVRAGARVVMVGGRDKLQPVMRGGAFRALSDRLGVVPLEEVHRQQSPALRGVVANLAEGRGRVAMQALRDARCTHARATRREAAEGLVESWAVNRPGELREALLLGMTRKDAEQLNALAQNKRIERGEVQASNGARAAGRLRVFEGDRVVVEVPHDQRMHSALRSQGALSGDRGVVEKRLLGGGVRVLLDRARDAPTFIESPLRSFLGPKPIRIEVPAAALGQVGLGYADTLHRAQSAQVRHIFLLAHWRMCNRQSLHQSLSRASEAVTVFGGEDSLGAGLGKLDELAELNAPKELASVEQAMLPTQIGPRIRF